MSVLFDEIDESEKRSPDRIGSKRTVNCIFRLKIGRMIIEN
jgi:hypothetical protein